LSCCAKYIDTSKESCFGLLHTCLKKYVDAYFFIWDPLGANARFLSFYRTQSRAVSGLLTGHYTLRRHLYLMGLSDILLCRRRGAEDETSAHILCECEAWASLRYAYLGSFFMDTEDIKIISLGAVWNLSKVTGPS